MDKRKLGYLIAFAGGLLFIYAIGFFDTTVAVDAYTRVHNLGLLNQQKNMMWAGGLLVIVGLVVALQLKAKFSSSLLASPDTHVKCPDCKELILKEARVCKHCGCKLIPL